MVHVSNLISDFKKRNIFLDKTGILDPAVMTRNEEFAAFFIMGAVPNTYNDYRIIPSLEVIRTEISRLYDTDPAVLSISPTRKGEVREPRQLAQFMSRLLTKESTSTIGEYFGGRNHSTVNHSTGVISNEFETNQGVSDNIHALCACFHVPIAKVYDFIWEFRQAKRMVAS